MCLLPCQLLRTLSQHLLTTATASTKCHTTVVVADAEELKGSIVAAIEAAAGLGAIVAKAVDVVVGVIEAIVEVEMASVVEDVDEVVGSEAIADVVMQPNRQVTMDPALVPCHLPFCATEF